VAAQSPELLGPQGTLALASPLFGIPLSPIVRFIGGHLSFLLSQTYITATLSAKKKICPSFEENDLTNDSYFYQNFFDHPLKCGPPTWGWVHAINHALQQLPQTITRLKHPTLIMYSHDDKVVDPEETQRMISKLQEQKKPPLMEEGFFNMKHVLFHDKNRSKVFQRLYRFYDTSKFISDKKRSRR
jgi:alpha-beta hydrolase superfamily lysophospholipase